MNKLQSLAKQYPLIVALMCSILLCLFAAFELFNLQGLFFALFFMTAVATVLLAVCVLVKYGP